MLDIFHIGRHEKGGMAWILDIRKKTKKYINVHVVLIMYTVTLLVIMTLFFY